MRMIGWRAIVGAASLLLGAAASAQTVVNDIGLTNPSGISLWFFQNGDGSSRHLSSQNSFYPDPENFPDVWQFNASASGYFRPASFSMSNDVDDVTHFLLTIGNSPGTTMTATSSTFLVVVSGLTPENTDYELSGVEFSVSPTYSSDLFDLHVFPDGLSSGSYGSGSFFLTNSFFNGVLAIAIAGNFSFLAGTNLVISGTFNAIDASAVPEPAVAALVLAIGAAGFVVWRRRTSRAA